MYLKLSEINPDIMDSYNQLISFESIPPRLNPKIPIPFIVLTSILLPISISLIAVGSYSLNFCPSNPNLPLWMILLGFFILFDRAITCILELNMYYFKKDNTKPDREMGVLIDWEARKGKHRLRISQNLMITVIGFLFL
uniref:NADH-ubiquinone oxidoreductase chain 3 n=1 Tax=Caenorhabditis tropicalis TaxID=1561998 RepID=A0A1I7T6F0_9PELO